MQKLSNINDSQKEKEKVNNKAENSNQNKENLIQELEIPDFSSLNKEELIRFLEKAVEHDKPLNIAKFVSEAKTYFDEITQNEYDEALKQFVDDEENTELDFSYEPDPLKKQFLLLYKQFRKKCNQLKEDIHNIRKENLEKKQELIEKLKKLTEETENHNSYQKFKQIQAEWRKVGHIPPTEIDNIWNTYNYYINKFYDNLSLHSELKELDRKKNLETKKDLIKKAFNQLDEPNIEKASEQMLKIQNEWKYTGPVTHQYSDEIQIEFQNVVTKFYEKQQLHKEEIEALREKNYEAKIALIENIKQLTEIKSNTPSEWIENDKKLTELLELWKNIGLVPSHKVSLVRNQFREAIRYFKSNKNQFFTELKKTRSHNLNEKREICNEIEEITAKDDFYNYRKEIKELQEKWKNTGSVSKNKLEKAKQQFNTVCDNYYKKLTEYNKSLQEIYKKNYIQKESYLKELENEIENIKNIEKPEKYVMEIQQKWMDLGYVPYEKKQEINQKFNSLLQKMINSISTDNLNIHPDLLKFKLKVENILNKKEDSKQQVVSEIKKLKLQYANKKDEVKSIENNIELFNFKSKDGKKLKADLDSKINNIKKSMEMIEEKIAIIKKVSKN